jgi:cytoskeletal protein CcmA (bactofilin family)
MMVFQARPRFILAVLCPVLFASTVSCYGSGRRSFTRLGDDVISSGSTYLTERDSVSGDAIIVGRDVETWTGIGGDYLGAAGNQKIGGRIHGSVRAAGGEIHVWGTIDRNATIAGGSVTLDSTADVTRNAYLVGGNVSVNGAVRGNLLASAGNVVLNGTIGRDVEVRGDALRIGPHAVITGNLRYRVPAGKVHIDSAARISGTVTALPISKGWSLKRWLWTLGFLVVGAIVVALLPRFTAAAAEIIPERPFRSALVGLGWFILVPIAIIIAVITVIGIPLAIVSALLYGIVAYLSTIPFAVWVGRLLLGARNRAGRQGVLLSFLVGGILLLAVQMIPILGPIVALIAGCVGLGAIMLRTIAVRREAQTV